MRHRSQWVPIILLAFINIFPPLYECGYNMLNNYESWGERRKKDIREDGNIKDKAEEIFKAYTIHEKKYGDRTGIETIITNKRKIKNQEV
jgi:hypothetical protein